MIMLLIILIDSLEALWFENDAGASFTNLSCLPALLNSSCLQKLSSLSSLSSQASCPQVWFSHEILIFLKSW